MTEQGEFNFQAGVGEKGHQLWLASRKTAARELARRLNLPVGHEVEVCLVGGVCLRGRLRLKEDSLFVEEERVRHLELLIDRVSFTCREIESCVRMD